MNETFSQTLLNARQTTGLSQVRAARIAGVPRATWQSWEAGHRTPPEYVQAMILRVCEKQADACKTTQSRERVTGEWWFSSEDDKKWIFNGKKWVLKEQGVTPETPTPNNT